MVLQLIAPMAAPKVAGATGTATITRMELHQGSITGPLVADLLTNPNPTLTVEQEYYLVVDVTKTNPTDDCWVSVNIPYWMSPMNMVGGSSWKTPGAAVTHTAIDKVVAFSPALYTGTGAPGVGSSAGNTGAGKVTYHLMNTVTVANFAVSMKPNYMYYIGANNGAGNQLVAVPANQLTVACGDMSGTVAGAQTDIKSTQTITKTSTGYASIAWSSYSYPTIASGQTATTWYIAYSGGLTPTTTTHWEFDIDWSSLPSGATVTSVTLGGRAVTLTSTGATSAHAVLDVPTGLGAGQNLAATISTSSSVPAGTYPIPVTNVQASTYGDENGYIRTNAGINLSITIKNTLDLSFAGYNYTRYDWYGQKGVKQDTLLGSVNLAASGPASLSSAPLTVHADFATNAIVRTIVVPKFTNAGTDITLTTASGITWTGPLSTVTLSSQSASAYTVVLNTLIPGVTSSDDSITSMTYDVGSMVGGQSTRAGNPNDLYSNNMLSLYGSFANGQKVVSAYTVYPTGSNASDPTAKATTTTGIPTSSLVISGSGTSASLSRNSLVAGGSTRVTSTYTVTPYPYSGTTSVYDYDPTFYLILPAGFSYANFTINGAPPATVTDVTTPAAAAAGKTIYAFQSPPGTEAGYYNENGAPASVAIAYDLLTSKSLSTNTYDVRDILAVGNAKFAASSATASANDASIPDTYGINGGRTLRGVPALKFTVQELKAVTVDNSMRVTADGGTTYTPWSVYNSADPNNTRAYMNSGMTAEYKVTFVNQTGGVATGLQAFVPIPKAGQNFGPAFEPNGPAEFNLSFSDLSIPPGFTTTYLKMNPGVSYAVGQVPQPGDYTVLSGPNDPAGPADMVLITAATLADAATADVTFKVDLGTLATGDYGKIDIWNVVPEYDAGSSHFVAAGSPEAIEIAGGVIKGTVYKDVNHNGVMDGTEVGLSGVTVTVTDNFVNTDGTVVPRVLTTTTDASGNYTFNFVRNTTTGGFTNDGIKLNVSVTNPDGTVYVFSPTTTTGNKPSVVTPLANQSSASKADLTAQATTPVVVDAGLIPAKTVTYVAGTGGTIGTPGSESVLYEDSPAHVPTTTPDSGYTFSGWKLSADVKASAPVTVAGVTYAAGDSIPAGTLLSSADVAKIIVTDDLTATAVFTANIYTITYDLDGGIENPLATNPTSYTVVDTPITLNVPVKAGYIFGGWTGSNGTTPQVAVTIPIGTTGDLSYVATWTPSTTTAYHVEHYWVDSSGAVSLHETESLTATTSATVIATAKDYSAAHYAYSAGYPSEVTSGTVAADGSLVLKLYYTQTTVTASVRYHKFTATGEVIATVPITGDHIVGDVIDPAALLDTYKPAGFAGGVPVGTWTVTGDGMVFDVYYPDTAPVIHVERPVIYVRQPATLTLADILRIAGVSITDAEESIPLSALQASGYSGIKWSVVNYPDGADYTITLAVSDTPGLDAPYQQIAIFVEAADTPIDPTPGPVPPPPGKKWGRDPQGHLVLYIPTLALPQTGDVLVAAPLAFALAGLGALALVSLRRRRLTS